jgi:hypothetical protein
MMMLWIRHDLASWVAPAMMALPECGFELVVGHWYE